MSQTASGEASKYFGASPLRIAHLFSLTGRFTSGYQYLIRSGFSFPRLKRFPLRFREQTTHKSFGRVNIYYPAVATPSGKKIAEQTITAHSATSLKTKIYLFSVTNL